MKLPQLHDFQEKIAGRIRDFLGSAEPGRGLVSLPTGAGKTRVATESLTRAYRDGSLRGVVLWLADRQELCEQAVQSWREVWRACGPEAPLRISRLWGDTNNHVEMVREKHHVVVATFQSLLRRIVRADFNWLTEASCVVIDEAHGSVTPSYTEILRRLDLTPRHTARPLIGLTATPFRGRADDEGSETMRLVNRYGGNRFDRGTFDDDDPYPLLRRIGVLSDAQFGVLEGVEFELSPKELEEFEQFDRLPSSVEARLGEDSGRNARIVNRVVELPKDWPTLIFAASLDHAELLAALLAKEGVAARAISSRTDQSARRHAIEQFKAGEIQVLTNYGVLTTGFDAPKTGALFVTRPIYSPGLYMQVVGRGLRGPANGGTDSCLIVNVEDNLLQYGSELAFRQFEHLWAQVRGEYY
jgi:superfamily II DNA or RNA helicase